MIVCIKNLLTLSLSSLQQSATTVQLNSSDPSFSQPISIYQLRLYKSPDAPSPKFIEKLIRTTGSDSSTREKENQKHGNFSKWVAWKKNQLKQIVGLPEHFNNNSVFQILLMSSKHRRQTRDQSWKNSPVIIQQQQQQ
jgi:hypothetical protein